MGLFDTLQGMPRRSAAGNPGGLDAPTAGTYLTGTGRDLHGLNDNDQPVKIHLSDPVRQALDELVNYYDSNLSVLVRHILFVDLYGLYDLHARAERGNRSFMPFKARHRVPDISFSLRTEDADPPRTPAADLGKNRDNVKIWLPARMVNDIDALAAQAGSNRSVYIREALVRYLFGRVQLPEKA